MDRMTGLEDIFVFETREKVKVSQPYFIRQFREIGNNLYVLRGQKETDALPDMALIVELMERMLEVASLLS